MRSSRLVISLFFLFNQWAFAQFTGGLVIDSGDYKLIQGLDLGSSGVKEAGIELPPVVSLKEFCPKPGFQGEITSCVGWATGYAAMSIQYALHQEPEMEEGSEGTFSPLFIYNQIKLTDCDFGAQIDDALRLIREVGNIPYQAFDPEVEGCFTLPSDEQLEQAGKNRIHDFYRIFSPGDDGETIIRETKGRLASGQAVIIAMIVNQGFTQHRSRSEFWRPIIGDQNPFGGHAMTVVGYDDYSDCFEIVNSWGQGWGNGGFFKIKYKDFADRTRFGFVIDYDGVPLKRQKLYNFTLGLQKYQYEKSNGELVFRPIKMTYSAINDNLFGTKLSDEGKYQVVLEGIEEFDHLLVYSVGEGDSTNLYAPYSEIIHISELSQVQSTIGGSKSIYQIPSAKSAIQFDGDVDNELHIICARKSFKDMDKTDFANISHAKLDLKESNDKMRCSGSLSDETMVHLVINLQYD